MPWITPTREPTLAELLSHSSISGGSGINAALLQQPPNQWLEALKQVAPAITSYIQKKKSDDIANQLLRDTGAPPQYQDRGAIGLQAWNQLHQFRENQPDTAMDDLDYQIKYRQAHPEEFPDQPYYGRGGNPRYPVQLPDGRTVYVTGNEALDHYSGLVKKGDFADVEAISGKKWSDWNQLAENDLAHIRTDDSGNIVGDFRTGKDKEGNPTYERRSMPVEMFKQARERYQKSQGLPEKEAPSAETAPRLTEKDQQALEWARSHPDDPRAAAILKKLGLQ
jgi:hypothetical protein